MMIPDNLKGKDYISTADWTTDELETLLGVATDPCERLFLHNRGRPPGQKGRGRTTHAASARPRFGVIPRQEDNRQPRGPKPKVAAPLAPPAAAGV